MDPMRRRRFLSSLGRTGALLAAGSWLDLIGYAQVITPTNTAVAVNYVCTECLTQAIALQDIVTLPSMPDEVTLASLSSVWSQLEMLNESFHLLPLNEVYADLVSAQTQILSILGGTVTTTVGGTTNAGTTTTETTTSAPAGGTTPSEEPATTSPDEGPTSTSDQAAETTADPGTTSTDEGTTTTDEGATTTDGGGATGEAAGTTTTSP